MGILVRGSWSLPCSESSFWIIYCVIELRVSFQVQRPEACEGIATLPFSFFPEVSTLAR